MADVLEQDYFNNLSSSTTGGNAAQTTNKLVGAIDQGTSSTRFLLFTSKGRIAASAQMEHEQFYPQTGHHEHDPVTLWQNTVACIAAVAHRLSSKLQLNRETVAAIGITNQRETVIAWNRVTGQPYHRAIVWDDTRTAEYAEALAAQTDTAAALTATTGLPMSSYFAGTKVKWLLDHVEELRRDVNERPAQVCFGTVDSWLLFQLTGHKLKQPAGAAAAVTNTGGCFKTDVTNASRWLFMDLQTCQWHPDSVAAVVAPHHLPVDTVLPEICPSAHLFGTVADDCGLPASLHGVPLASVLGDQQAALFGQTAHRAGQAKNTYGTGLFLMMNTGTTPCTSTHGLLTTVAYQIGNDSPVHYALEGSVSHAGSTIQWLRDQLQILPNASASEPLARSVASSEGLYLVPAFAGLFAPHWRSDARGCIVGMQMSHGKGHICRAALEAAAYQTKEVFDAIVKDARGIVGGEEGLASLSVDGGGTNNKLLMQFQADIIDVPVVKPKVMETTALGAAFAAGLTVGVWKDLEEIQKLWAVAETFTPNMSEEDRAQRVHNWNKAVSKSLGWIGDNHAEFVPIATPVSSRHLAASLANGAKNNISEPPVSNDVAEATQTVEEEKKSAEPRELLVNEVVTSREIPMPTSKAPANESTASFTAATLGLTAAASLVVGILIGGARNKR